MSDTVTIPVREWHQLKSDINFLKTAMLQMARTYKAAAWVSQKEAEEITGLKDRSLRELRKKGTLSFRCSATGRKIQYLRADLEKYLTDFTTLVPNQIKKVV
jgi:hypothetical protein